MQQSLHLRPVLRKRTLGCEVRELALAEFSCDPSGLLCAQQRAELGDG